MMKRIVEIDCRGVFLVEVEAPDEKSAVEQAELMAEELVEAHVDEVFSVTDCGPTDEVDLCSDCPPEGHPTDETRCDECPRFARSR